MFFISYHKITTIAKSKEPEISLEQEQLILRLSYSEDMVIFYCFYHVKTVNTIDY